LHANFLFTTSWRQGGNRVWTGFLPGLTQNPPFPATFPHGENYRLVNARLTHTQQLLVWKPSPLRPSSNPSRGFRNRYNPIEYLLLQPRSAPVGAIHPLCHHQRLHGGPTVSPYMLPVLDAPSQQQSTITPIGLRRHPFSGLSTSAGELLHTPKQIPTFMATDLLSSADNTLCGVCVLAQESDTLHELSVHSASPVLLTSSGPLGTSTLPMQQRPGPPHDGWNTPHFLGWGPLPKRPLAKAPKPLFLPREGDSKGQGARFVKGEAGLLNSVPRSEFENRSRG